MLNMIENSYDLDEIKEDFNKIVELLNKHQQVVSEAKIKFLLFGNQALLESEEDDGKNEEYKKYKANELAASYLIHYVEDTFQPIIQTYIDHYINHFSKEVLIEIDEEDV